MIDRIGEDFSFHQQAIELRQQRQEVLAANIANADTPNFKARDFNFGEVLQETLGERMRLPDTQLALTSARHIPAKAVTPDPTNLLYRQPLQPSLDGNTVDMNVERVAFADNTLRYQSSLTVISQRIKTMMAALQQ
jgi:flagellar basal-body rod protein FlgB